MNMIYIYNNKSLLIFANGKAALYFSRSLSYNLMDFKKPTGFFDLLNVDLGHQFDRKKFLI